MGLPGADVVNVADVLPSVRGRWLGVRGMVLFDLCYSHAVGKSGASVGWCSLNRCGGNGVGLL